MYVIYNTKNDNFRLYYRVLGLQHVKIYNMKLKIKKRKYFFLKPKESFKFPHF